MTDDFDNNLTPAIIVKPTEVIEMELEARGWTVRELANYSGIPLSKLEAIMRGVQPITKSTASGIGNAFGTGAEVWLNMETTYRSRIAPRSIPSK